MKDEPEGEPEVLAPPLPRGYLPTPSIVVVSLVLTTLVGAAGALHALSIFSGGGGDPRVGLGLGIAALVVGIVTWGCSIAAQAEAGPGVPVPNIATALVAGIFIAGGGLLGGLAFGFVLHVSEGGVVEGIAMVLALGVYVVLAWIGGLGLYLAAVVVALGALIRLAVRSP